MMVINQAQSLKVVKFITDLLSNIIKSIIDDPTRQIKEVDMSMRYFNAELERIHKLTNLAVSGNPYQEEKGSDEYETTLNCETEGFHKKTSKPCTFFVHILIAH